MRLAGRGDGGLVQRARSPGPTTAGKLLRTAPAPVLIEFKAPGDGRPAEFGVNVFKDASGCSGAFFFQVGKWESGILQ